MQAESGRLSLDTRYADGRYAEENPDWHEGHARWKAAHVASILAQHGLLSGAGAICDIGCGAGGVLEELGAEVSPEVRLVGYDPSPEALERAAQLRSDRVEVRLLDDLAAIGTDWDVALALDVLEHVPDYIGFLTTTRRVAKAFVFHIPLDLNVQMVARRDAITSTRESVGHLHYFSRETALATLRDSGYEVVDDRLTLGTVDLPPSWRARLLRHPRRIAYRLAPKLAERLIGGASLLALARRDDNGRDAGEL